MKDDEWDAIMATNLKPAFRLAKAVLRGMMKARHGRIIQIGSVVGSSGNAGQANYAAAKAALIGFTKSLAQEVGSRNITVNCVAPGFIDTDMTKALPEAQREALLSRIPLGRLGAPDDIAQRGGVPGEPAAPATSPARRCTSTAACTWRDVVPRAGLSVAIDADQDRPACAEYGDAVLVKSAGFEHHVPAREESHGER